jgi:hypothetical protein
MKNVARVSGIIGKKVYIRPPAAISSVEMRTTRIQVSDFEGKKIDPEENR